MPICPQCKKPMKKKEFLSIFYAIETAIENAVRSAAFMPPKKTEWACTAIVTNPEYIKWLQRKRQNDSRLPILRQQLPPPPPQQVPCKNHWSLTSSGLGVMTKKRKKFFYYNDVLHFVTEKRAGLQ